MLVKLDVVEKIDVHHNVVVEVDDEEEVDMIVNECFDDCISVEDVVAQIESYDIKAELKEKEVLTEPDGFELYSEGEVES